MIVMDAEELDPHKPGFNGYEKVTCLVTVNDKGDKERATLSRAQWAYLQWLEDYRHLDANDFFMHCAKRFHDYPLAKILQPCVSELVLSRDRQGLANPPWMAAVEAMPDWWYNEAKKRIPPL